jgi:spermidine/putrescine transport system substrate-binding protein
MSQPRRSVMPRRQFLQRSAAAALGLGLANCTGKPSQSLSVYLWADYSSRRVFDRFSKESGIATTIDNYDSNETMLAKVQTGGAAAYSLLYPTDYMVKQMADLGLLQSIDSTKIPNLSQISDRWKSPTYDPNNQHSIPFSWGTTGFLRNTKVFDKSIADWSDLWTHREALKGKLILMDDMREVMGGTLKSLGYSYNSTNATEIEAAYKRLRELKPSIAQFSSFGWESQLISGDIAVAMSFSGPGNSLPKANPVLDFTIPKGGTSLWTDTIVIPKTAPNLEAAYQWINFILKPENLVDMLGELSFAPVSQTAIDQLPAATRSNAKLFPPQELLAKCETIASVGDSLQLYEKFWMQLKSA